MTRGCRRPRGANNSRTLRNGIEDTQPRDGHDSSIGHGVISGNEAPVRRSILASAGNGRNQAALQSTLLGDVVKEWSLQSNRTASFGAAAILPISIRCNNRSICSGFRFLPRAIPGSFHRFSHFHFYSIHRTLREAAYLIGRGYIVTACNRSGPCFADQLSRRSKWRTAPFCHPAFRFLYTS